jgi:TPR repeat protein
MNSKTQGTSSKSITIFERSANLGCVDAKMALLIVRLQAEYKKAGEALSLDPFYADFGRLAAQGGARVKTIYARYLAKQGKTDKNHALAKLMLLKAAGKGYPEANYQLGRIYHYGTNEDVNYPLAQQYYLLGANKFHLEAQLALSLLYDHGNLGSIDRKAAFRWFTMCRSSVDLWCLHNMGIMMRDGHVPVAGYAEAINIFKFIAGQDHASGINNYAAMLDNGQGAVKDPVKAFELYKKSADMGDLWAQFNLCKIYYYGTMKDIVAQNPQKGVYWCEKSAKQGLTQAKAKLQEIRG